jgi:hypothetical protein
MPGTFLTSEQRPDGTEGFVPTDLVIALHRDQRGDWIGSRAMSSSRPTGFGVADALLIDDEGPAGRALQTLLLRPAVAPS